MENGVKQGGVLSPILFCVYFDELLKRLGSSGMGCYIGHHFYGCVGYADDAKLLCPSINGLQSMINVCEIFADEFDVTFNTKKRLCICYGSDNNATLRQVSLDGVKIPWQSTVKHLGNVLMYNLHDEADVYKKRAAVNKMNSVFTSVHAELKLSLLQTYCASWYGCQAWQLGTPYCDLMDVEWRKAVRRTAGLPRQTRRSCFLVWRVMIIFFRNKNVGLPDYLILCLQATTLRFAFLPPERLFLPLEYLVVTEYTLQTSTSAVDSAKTCWSLLGAGPSPMKLPECNRFVSWCVPGMDWRPLTFLNPGISHWYLNSWPRIECSIFRVRVGLGEGWVDMYFIWCIILL